MSSARLMLPSALVTPRSTPTFTTQILSNSTYKIAIAFIAEDSVTVNALGIRLGAILGTSPTYQIELQGLDGSGIPDGNTVSGSNITFNPSSSGWAAGTFHWLSIGGATLVRGNPYALVVKYSSGTIDTSNNASFTLYQGNAGVESCGLPYALADTGSGYAKSSVLGEPLFGYRTATQTYGNPFQGYITGGLVNNGNRAALKLTLDSGWGSTYAVRGLFFQYATPAAGGTVKAGIWSSAGAEIASCTLDSDHAGGTSTVRQMKAFFSAAPTLAFGGTYYFGMERVATVNPTLKYIEVSDNRDLEAYPFGSGAVLSTWNGTAWTDTNTQLFLVSLILESWTKPASGGGNVSIVMG